MARLSGKNGAVNLGAGFSATGDLVGISSWTINYTGDVHEATGFDSAGIKSYVAGCTGWSGTFSGHWDNAEAKLVGAAPSLMPGATGTATFDLTQTAGNNYSGTIFITSQSITTPVDGIIDYTCDFQGSGALTEATA